MWKPFSRKKPEEEKAYTSIWKDDFSNCKTQDYLPSYSICCTEDNLFCRYIARYANVVLCTHPKHKTFISEGSEPFDSQNH